MPLTSAIVIINSGSGRDLSTDIEDLFKQAGKKTAVTYNCVTLKKDDKIPERCEQLVKQAAAEKQAVIAAGGDGTVSLIASLCHKHHVTMGIIPLGTFNYFARDLNISVVTEEAIAALATAEPKSVAVGMVNDRLFLNNASFGIYTRIIRERERTSARFGRVRFLAALSALKCLLGKYKPHNIQLVTGETTSTRQTPMLFVGNNALQLDNLGLGSTRCAEQDRLAVIFMQPMNRWRTLTLFFHGAKGTLRHATSLDEFCAENFEVHTRKRQVEIAMDGELVRLSSPLHFHIEKNALNVLVPKPEV